MKGSKHPRRDIPPEAVKARLKCDESGRLFWRESHNLSNQEAGYITPEGYRALSFFHEGKQRKLQAHRVVWLLVHGDWPTQTIDHINRNRADNRPENLRDVSFEVNTANRAAVRDGVPGVYARGNKFKAQIRVKGRCTHLGTFASSEAAASAIKQARQQMEVR